MNNKQKGASRISLVAALALVIVFPLSAGAVGPVNKLIVMDSTGSTNSFVVRDDGYVGIGTGASALLGSLHIKSPTPQGTQIVVQTTGPATYNADAAGGLAFFRNNAGGALPLANDRLGYFTFGGIDAVSVPGTTSYRYSTGVLSRAEAAWTATSTPSFLSFETTAANLTTRSEKLRVTGAGNVGIGTTTPTQKLEVKNGGIRLNAGAAPSCTTEIRGTLWLAQSSGASGDILYVCASVGNNATPIWRTVSFQ
jgi:hypothetical protein